MSDAPDERAVAPSKPGLEAVLFDMDGVITDTAEAHAAAWKQLFDHWLGQRDGDFRPFDDDADYRAYVDGKPRYDGVRSFLASRGIELPFGSPDDSPEQETICGLGNRKNRYFNDWLAANRVQAYPGSLDLVARLRRAGLRLAVFSASRNATAVLESAGVRDRFDVKVDGSDMAELDLPGKPDPAILLRAARLLAVAPARAAVVEDAVAGVEAGVAGGFAQTIGVDRQGRGERLLEAGADLVVADLGELALPETRRLVTASPAPGPTAPAAKTGSPDR